ncbi:MAG: hypothetical protein LBG70_01945 [Bifidobacteriaceae bacterium]|nr:hypothetical protein [Bifidobacteriaceae bacterium]
MTSAAPGVYARLLDCLANGQTVEQSASTVGVPVNLAKVMANHAVRTGQAIDLKEACAAGCAALAQAGKLAQLACAACPSGFASSAN